MNFILQTTTAQYLKNISTNEETFFRGTSEFDLSFPIDEQLSNRIENGEIQIIEKTEEHFVDEATGHVIPKNQYHKVRNYGQYHGQLDDLWHDIDDGFFGENAKNGVWYNKIKDLKDKFPKP